MLILNLVKSTCQLEIINDKDYAAKRRALISETRYRIIISSGSEIPFAKETCFTLTVADKDGNMVSLIQSNYLAWAAAWYPMV